MGWHWNINTDEQRRSTMNRFDIINRIGDKYRVGNTETGEFSYAQALKTVGKDIKDYQKATTGTQHKFLDLRFENERLAVLVECKNKFSRWDAFDDYAAGNVLKNYRCGQCRKGDRYHKIGREGNKEREGLAPAADAITFQRDRPGPWCLPPAGRRPPCRR